MKYYSSKLLRWWMAVAVSQGLFLIVNGWRMIPSVLVRRTCQSAQAVVPPKQSFSTFVVNPLPIRTNHRLLSLVHATTDATSTAENIQGKKETDENNNNNNNIIKKDLIQCNNKKKNNEEEEEEEEDNSTGTSKYIFNTTVTILEQSEHYVVVSKPPGVVCHHSDWSGSRKMQKKKKMKQQNTDNNKGMTNDGQEESESEPSSASASSVVEVPMLQRTREAIGERVNLVHRLDRGASGCLLFTKVASDEDGFNATSTLQHVMTTEGIKTYIALVRGEGIYKGHDLKADGWFKVDRPIKNENGNINDATTYFRFVAGQHNDSGKLDRPRASLVLARPRSGRWHQIRKHLNGLGHPIIGDSTHGDRRTNRRWKEKYDLLPERTCLHLLKLELPSPKKKNNKNNDMVCPSGISVYSPLEDDMYSMLQTH